MDTNGSPQKEMIDRKMTTDTNLARSLLLISKVREE